MAANSSFSCLLKETEHGSIESLFSNPLEKHPSSPILPKPNTFFTQIADEESSLNPQNFSHNTLMDDAWVVENLSLLSNSPGKGILGLKNQNVGKTLRYSG